MGLAALAVTAVLVVQIVQVLVPPLALVVGLALLVDGAAYIFARLAGRPTAGLRFSGWLVRPFLWTGRLVAMAGSGWRPVRAQSVDQLLALSPPDFEKWTGQLLRHLGYRDVRVVGGRGDLGVDIRAVDPQGRTVGVQCKRYSDSRVSSRDMQHFYAMLFHHRLEHGIFVTTSTFTDAARGLARDHDIELFDREILARLL
ncbi:MAG TPA: restriction endonuclease [Acidimicrobiales bacterium]|nr:restriction endonuclease [Acidimicrobiales bacterium]